MQQEGIQNDSKLPVIELDKIPEVADTVAAQLFGSFALSKKYFYMYNLHNSNKCNLV